MSLECVLGQYMTSLVRHLGGASGERGAVPRLPVMPFAERFDYLGRLGKGGQGVVHHCRDRLYPGVEVAVKLARRRPEALQSLATEARTLAVLRGSAAVPALRALLVRDRQLCGFATRYFPGETLERHLARCRRSPGARLPRERQVPVARAVGEAVLEVLDRGFLHRDLKPGNLLLGRKGQIQIFDFGLARRISELPRMSELSGTLAYASPEQVEARSLDARSDLFSLGLILYELATGRMFFPARERTFRAFLVSRARRLRETPSTVDAEPRLAALIRRLIVADRRLRANLPEVRSRLDDLS